MEHFSNKQRYPLWLAQRESQGVRQLIREGEAKDYAEASALVASLKTDFYSNNWASVFAGTTAPNPEIDGPASEEDLKVMASELIDDTEWIEGFEHSESQGFCNWTLIDNRYVPADENWEPKDPLPCNPEEICAGDICYVSMPSDCENCQDTPRQLAFVFDAQPEDGIASIMVINDIDRLASDQDVILEPNETKLPFQIVVEFTSGPVLLSQLSEPVGRCNEEIVDVFYEGYLDSKPHFPKEKLGKPIATSETQKVEFQIERQKLMDRLSCYCLSKMYYEDDLADETDREV